MPPQVGAAEMLSRIHGSVVEHAEAGPVGELLDRSEVSMPSADEQPQLDQVVERSAGRLADELVTRPEQPAEGVWSAVRTSILDEVATQRRAQRWPLVAAALAASIAISGIAVQMISESEGTSDSPAIVFTELDTPPDVEFAVLRYGSRR